MTKLQWDLVGERTYETGVDQGVLYIPNGQGVYDKGVAWNGLVTVTESPTGAAATALYADNIKYLNLVSVEQFDGTIDAYTYPDEFSLCDGTIEPEPGVIIGQQRRHPFGLAYRTRVGNDVDGTDHGYKIHLVYGAQAAPSQKAFGTINDTPAAISFSWTFTTTPVPVPNMKPASTLVIDSTKVASGPLAQLQGLLYGTSGADARLPLPTEVLALFAGSVVAVTTVQPTYNSSTDIVTIPATTGVVYTVNGAVVPAGAFGPITETIVVRAHPADGYIFTDVSDNSWTITFA